MRKLLSKNFFFLLVFLLILFIFRSWLTTEVLCKGDCIYFYPDNLESFFDIPYFWNTSPAGSGFGYFALPTLTFSPPSVILGFFYHFFNLDFEIIEKIVWFTPFLIFSFSGILFLTRALKVGTIGSLSASVFYITNTYILLVADGGQVGILMAYSLAPFLLALAVLSLVKGEIFWKILLGVTGALAVFFDLRIAYLSFGLVTVYYIYSVLLGSSLKRVLISFLFLAVIPLVIHSFWWVPLLQTSFTGIASMYMDETQIGFLSWMDLLDGLMIFQPHWPLNRFGKINDPNFYFVLIPFLAFLAPLLSRKSKEVLFFTLIALISVFFVKGGQAPGGGLYSFLFTHLPGFNMLRDPSKFYFPLALSYSLLLGYSIQVIYQSLSLPNFKRIFAFSLLIYLLFLTKAVWFGEMRGTFDPLKIPVGYLNLEKIIASQDNFSRTLWYPNKREFAYSSSKHPSLDATYDLFRQRPFDIATAGTYDIFSYLEHPFTPQLFDVLGVQYVITADSLKDYSLSETESQDKDRLLRVLGKTSWLKEISQDNAFRVYERDFWSDHFYVVDKSLGVIGSDKLYWLLGSIPGFRLRNLSMVFLDSYQGQTSLEGEIQDQFDYLVLNNKTQTDLAFLLGEREDFIFPALSLAGKNLGDRSWIIKGPFDNLSWQDILARRAFGNFDFDFGGGLAYADDYPQKLNFNFSLGEEVNGSLYVRHFSNHQGGEFQISVDGGGKKKVNTRTYGDNFIWQEVGRFQLEKGGHHLELENVMGFNAVNALVFLSDKEVENLSKKAEKILDENKLIYFYEVGEATKSGGLNFVREGNFEILVQTPSNLINGELIIKIDNLVLKKTVKTGDSNERWYRLGAIGLSKGKHTIQVVSSSIQEIVFFENTGQSFLDWIIRPSSVKLSYQVFNPTKYLVQVSSDERPVTLVFSERYHPFWEGVLGREVVRSKPSYNMLNSFRIGKGMGGEVLIEFSPQRRLGRFWPVSVIGILLVAVSLFYLGVKRRW